MPFTLSPARAQTRTAPPMRLGAIPRMAVRWLAASLLAAGGVAAAAAEPSASDDMQARVAPCVTCHGKEGRATNAGYFPRIAGKPAGYLFHQLVNFREGRRVQAQMNHLVQNLSDAYLQEIAQYFAQLDLPYPPPQPAPASPAMLERGRMLALQGDASRDLPACAQCHGQALTGVAPNIPGLLGLPRDYVNAQLGAWKSGQRHAASPDCMAHVAEKLAPDDVGALSTWLAAQPVPDNARPEPVLRHRLPMPCGDVRAPGDHDMGAEAGAAAPVSPAVPATPGKAATQVERGAYLALAGNCAGCHTARGGAPYAGGVGLRTPFGMVYAGNLTPDDKTGIGTWNADQFWQAIHEGRSSDGRLLYPAFPYPSFTEVTREDSDAIFAWLRTLEPVQKTNRPHELRFPYNTQAALRAWRALFFKPATFTPDATRSPQWNRGAYLVRGLGHCAACHSTRNVFGAVTDEDLLAGGLIPMQNWYAPSLASQQEAGVAHWKTEDVVALLGSGVARGASVMGPMAEVVYRSTQHLATSDLEAIAVYLKELAPQPARTERQQPGADGQFLIQGAKVYEQHCAQCHGDSGQGKPGKFPALAGNRAVTLANPTNVIRAVLDGGYLPATSGNPRPYGMPPFSHALDNGEIAAVVSWIRTSWGNAAAPVTDIQVLQYR